MIGAQLNVTEARHRLVRRRIFCGQRGQLRQHYREGMEDQLGALGLALNAVVLFNSLYIDAAVKQVAADGFSVTDDLLARLPRSCTTTSTSSAATPSPPRPPRGSAHCATPTRKTTADRTPTIERGRAGRIAYAGSPYSAT